jgi:predicted CopG family antitoxin
MVVKHLNLALEEEVFKKLVDFKGNLSWNEFIIDPILKVIKEEEEAE